MAIDVETMKRHARSFSIGVLGALLVVVLVAVALWLADTAGANYEIGILVVFLVAGLAIVVGYFCSSTSSLSGFVVRWKRESRTLFPAPLDGNDDVIRDARRVRDTFLFIALVGLTGIFIYALQFKPHAFARIFGSAVVASIASMTFGIALGFLFGIPRTLQGDNPAPTAPAAGTAGTASATAARSTPNTNLEQISDWLTKIIVGLGLVHLTKIPEYLGRLIRKLAPYLNRDENLALGIIIGYATCGFLLGYLLTRLYLTRALTRAQLSAERLVSELDKVLNNVERDRNESLNRVPDASKGQPAEEVAEASAAREPGGPGDPEREPVEPVSTAEVAAATKLQELAKTPADLEALRRQIDELAAEYETIRREQKPSWDRTRNMEIVASKMRALSLACYSFLPWLTTSPSPGHRLAAVSFLEMKANSSYLGWLEQRFAIEQPFIGYHAAWALRQAARELPLPDLPAVESAVRKALDIVGLHSTHDRAVTLRAALDEVLRRRK